MFAGILLVWALAGAPASAGDISWGSSLLQDNRDSTDSPLDGSFTFYLGVFNPPAPGPGEPPWVPDATNTHEWAGHWITADVARYHPAASNFFAEYGVQSHVEGVSLTGMQGYIWGVNRRCPDGEWILITAPGWIWPAPGSGLGFPANWTASDGIAMVGQLDQGGVHLRTEPVTDGTPPLLPAEYWRRIHFTPEEIDTRDATVSGWLADPNGNGRPNIIEYALGTDPRVSQLDKEPVHGFVALTGSSYQTLRATIDPNTDLTIGAEVTADLVNWFDGPSHVTLQRQSAAELLVRDLTPVSSATPFRAMRLKVSLP